MAASVLVLLACSAAWAQSPQRPAGTVTAPPNWSAPANPGHDPAITPVAWREAAPTASNIPVPSSVPREVPGYHGPAWAPGAQPSSAKPQSAQFRPPPTSRMLALEKPAPLPRPQPPSQIQLATDKYRVKPDDSTEPRFYTDIPGLQRVTRLESEKAFQQRMIQEARSKGERLVFPEDPPASKVMVVARKWPALQEIVEPNFLFHGRLFWDQPNFERHGWDVGVIQPVVSTIVFWWDTFTLPYNWGTHPFQRYECSAGLCQPGDPVPFLLPPPELRASGLAAQTAALFGVFLVFP